MQSEALQLEGLIPGQPLEINTRKEVNRQQPLSTRIVVIIYAIGLCALAIFSIYSSIRTFTGMVDTSGDVVSSFDTVHRLLSIVLKREKEWPVALVTHASNIVEIRKSLETLLNETRGGLHI